MVPAVSPAHVGKGTSPRERGRGDEVDGRTAEGSVLAKTLSSPWQREALALILLGEQETLERCLWVTLVQFSSVQFSILTDLVVGRTRGTIQHGSSSSLSCRNPL